MASITKRKGTYLIRCGAGYDIYGKQIKKNATFTPNPNMTPKQEEKALNEFVVDFERKVRTGQVLDSNITFKAFGERWFRDYAELNLSQKTLIRYRYLMKRISEEIGHIKLDKLRPHHLQALYYDLLENTPNKHTNRKLSPQTVAKYHRFISTVLTTAVEWQVIYDNPARRVKPPKITQKPIAYLDEAGAKQVIELLEDEPIKYKTFYILAIYSGLRRGELCGLKWQDIDFNNCVLSVNRTTQFIPKQGVIEAPTKTLTSNRVFKLPNEAIHLLKQYKRWQNTERLKIGENWANKDFIFTQWNGEPIYPDTVSDYFRKFIRKHGLDSRLSLHSLRHTNATLLIASGVDARTVASRLGHSKTSTTLNIYTHAIQSADAIASEKLGDLLNPTQASEA